MKKQKNHSQTAHLRDIQSLLSNAGSQQHVKLAISILLQHLLLLLLLHATRQLPKLSQSSSTCSSSSSAAAGACCCRLALLAALLGAAAAAAVALPNEWPAGTHTTKLHGHLKCVMSLVLMLGYHSHAASNPAQ
jgi:hypothetical protein